MRPYALQQSRRQVGFVVSGRSFESPSLLRIVGRLPAGFRVRLQAGCLGQASTIFTDPVQRRPARLDLLPSLPSFVTSQLQWWLPRYNGRRQFGLCGRGRARLSLRECRL